MEGWPFESSWGLRRNPELTARYEILRRIGGGNYGDVFQGRRRKDNLMVALKEIHHTQSSRRELDALLRLDNPNIVKLLEYFKKGSNVVLVLEYAPSNLADVIAAGPLGEAVIKGIILQIIRGLAVCHSTCIVHRDLKPSNILLSADGLLKIADFGNARIIKEQGGDSNGEQNLGQRRGGSEGPKENTGREILQELLKKERNSEEALVIEESPTSSGDGLINVGYFLEQEKVAGRNGIDKVTQKGHMEESHVDGTSGKEMTGQKQNDFFQKLKGFLKKSSHSSQQKPGQVTECDGPGAPSWSGSPNDGDSEYRQRSGRWISPVNSQLFVFDNKENQAQDQVVTFQNHPNSSASQEVQMPDCLSERWEKEVALGLQHEKTNDAVHCAMHNGSYRAEGNYCLNEVPSLAKQGEQTAENSNPVAHVGFDSDLACSQQQRQQNAYANEPNENTSHFSPQSRVQSSMEIQQLVEVILQDTDPNRDSVVPSQTGKVSTIRGVKSGQKQLQTLVADDRNKEAMGDSRTEDLSCTEDTPGATCVSDPKLVFSRADYASGVPEVADGNVINAEPVGAGISSQSEKRTLDRTWCTHLSQDEMNLHDEQLSVDQSCGTGHVNTSEAHGVDTISKLQATAVFEGDKEMQVLYSPLQSGSASTAQDVAFVSTVGAGPRVSGFFPPNNLQNPALKVFKWTDPGTVFEGLGTSSGARSLESADRPGPATYGYGLQPGRGKKTGKSMSCGNASSFESHSFSPLYSGSVGWDSRRSPDENSTSSFENWDRSVHEARRNLEQGGGVYGLYQHRGGWQGYNAELKCWGVITSKGKIIGQSLSQEGGSSKIPRIRPDKARMSAEKSGQRVSFLNGESLELNSRKNAECSPLSASERPRYPRPSQTSVASEIWAHKSELDVGTSSSSCRRNMKIPPRRSSKGFFTGPDSISNQKCDVDLQAGSGWISPSDRFNILPAPVAGYDNEMGLSTTDFYYPGQPRVEVEGRMGSEWGSPSERFEFMRVRPQGLQTESKSSLSDVSNIDGSDPGQQLQADAGLKNWSDVEKESESGQDGWDKASGEWSIDKDGFSGELEATHPSSLDRPGETRWFGAPEVKDSYLEVDCGSFERRALSPEQAPWNQFHEHGDCLEKSNKGKELVSEADILDLSNKEQYWDDSVRAGGYESPGEEMSAEFSDRSFSRSGSQDRDTDGGSDFTGCVGTRWYKSPEILYGATKYGKAIDLWAVGLIFADLLKGEALLPGLNDIDQLSRIVRFLGSPTESSWPGVSKLPDYDKIFFQDDRQPLCLDDEFPTASKACLRFLKKFLVYDPAQRLNAKEALDDEFFSVDPAPALPHEIVMMVPLHRRKDSNSEEWGEWREQESSSLSDFELLS